MYHKYNNGNYTVFINDDDGTKIRVQYDKSADFEAEFPESIDINIGRRCDGGCQFCYEGATPDGPEADLTDIPFLDSLRPYTEVAINGNSIEHPQLIQFLEELNRRNIFANLTINQIHFERKLDLIRELVDRWLICGLGVSLRKPTAEFIASAKKFPNLVVHTIAGVHGRADYEALKGSGLKVLVLGYKAKGRGYDYLVSNMDHMAQNMEWLRNNLQGMIADDAYKLISFDNLALEQLRVKDLVPPEKWEQFYLGDDGQYTFYVDLVDKTFGKSSLVPKEEMMPLLTDVAEMLKVVKQK